VITEFHTNFHAYSRHYGFGWLERMVSMHLRRLHNRGDLTLVPSHQLGIDLMRRGYRQHPCRSTGRRYRLVQSGATQRGAARLLGT
jgi:hypothetical protein